MALQAHSALRPMRKAELCYDDGINPCSEKGSGAQVWLFVYSQV